ncbi:biotin--[acetyl-CoA-carboxylase] ligase [Nesterenkonia sp. HG001]|uniref:biotin--[acetyl-CoA-carboxylase] ligase n=1 Tax=Nesterenkonia sp. HG001 TaxID=2983207 RepID=UPI002AC6C3B9|nr:biotin--[acetyl-CoA-carboxylase] ligase [Nesterenkonia sp. HG001]MDZ5076618.1 biotin--[acetyl-CoA-carboxylase] ligase [Nesterenkonia sp. HG001]
MGDGSGQDHDQGAGGSPTAAAPAGARPLDTGPFDTGPLDAGPLDTARLREELVSAGPYSQLRVLDTVDSTNLQLTRAAGEPGFTETWPHLSVLTAEEQTGATGRLGRGWSSPPRTSLSTSVVLRPGRDGVDPTPQLPWISLVAGLSLVEALRGGHGIPARLKWPNDVHVAGRKISGILSVLAPVPAGSRGGITVVLGVGVNVLLQARDLPTSTSTSVLLELRRLGEDGSAERVPGAQQKTDLITGLRTEVLVGLLERLAANLAELERTAASGSGIRDSGLGERIRRAMDTLGQEVRVELPGGSAARGVAVGLEQDGSLLVEVTHRRSGAEEPWLPAPGPAAERRRGFSAGDVVHLRRADG